ncbi:MAG: hypothetical protein QXO01_05200 [Nitrososphaerota archaeon]
MSPTEEPPDISELIRHNKIKRTHAPILLYLARTGGRARFYEIYQHLGGETRISKSTLKSRLDALSNLGVITYHEGVAELTNKSTLCYVVSSRIPYAYMGLLGIRGEAEDYESETETSIKLLKEEGIEFDRIYVVTTPEALESWSSYIKDNIWKRIELISVRVDEMNEIDKMMNRVRPRLLELIRQSIVIIDCTSGTRPAGIAFYTLAEKYKLPLIYVYKEAKKIYWLKSRQSIKKELSPIL